MISPWQPGQLLFAGFAGTTLPSDLAALIGAGRVGGVVLFARNVESPAQMRALVDELHARAPADARLCVAIDQEGGRVQRLRGPWTEWPAMRRLAERGSPADTQAVARALGRELADLRIDLDFAPVADVDTNPANPVIGDRSFSRDPEEVARHALAFTRGLQGEGVAACAKHFPGHGDTTVDSHHDLPRLDHDRERLERVELVPFRALAAAGVASMMTGHVWLPHLDPRLPATLSPRVLALLRGALAYDGLVFSDDLEMRAIADRFEPAWTAEAALAAGVDALLVCSRADLRDEVLGALEALPDARVEAGLRRMAEFKRRYAGGTRAAGGAPPYAAHRDLATRLA